MPKVVQVRRVPTCFSATAHRACSLRSNGRTTFLTPLVANHIAYMRLMSMLSAAIDFICKSDEASPPRACYASYKKSSSLCHSRWHSPETRIPLSACSRIPTICVSHKKFSFRWLVVVIKHLILTPAKNGRITPKLLSQVISLRPRRLADRLIIPTTSPKSGSSAPSQTSQGIFACYEELATQREEKRDTPIYLVARISCIRRCASFIFFFNSSSSISPFR